MAGRSRKAARIAVFLVGVALFVIPGRAAAQRVLGLDISAWQGNISQTTWNNIRTVENRQFVFLRSSRGGTTGYYNQNNAGNDNPPGQNTLSQRYDDPYFVQNINRATSAGIIAGSYHFSRPDIVASTLNSNGIPNNGTDEANHFMQMAGAWMRPGYLLPVHDFEAGDGFRTDNEMAQFAVDFSNRIFDVMGIRPAIYINGNYAQNILGGASAALRSQVVAAYPTLWSARWPNQAAPDTIDVQNGHPKDSFTNIYGPWDDGGVTHPWQFWQYASTGRLQSFNNGGSNLDFNVAQGDIEYLKDQLVPAIWMNNSSGDWSTLANWNSGQTPIAPVTGPGQVPPVGTQTLPTPRLPGAAGSGVTSGQSDTVILDRPSASITVSMTTGTFNIRKLFVRESLQMTGGSLTVNYDPTYQGNSGSFPNALRSGLLTAQFSGAVSLSGNAAFSAHTLQVDATRTFTVGGGSLTFNRINLMPHGSTPAKLAVSGDFELAPLNHASAVIANGAGSGSSGLIDLTDGQRTFHVANGSASVDVTISVPITNGGLTKDGAGTLSLTGNNSYAGDTRIQGGTLRISSPFLANSADVYLTSGAIFDLGFVVGPDTIDALFIDGVPQPAGIWGAIGSGAQFTTPLLTGQGYLQVTTSHPSADFDFDSDFDCQDVNALVSQIVSGAHLPAFDLSGDSLVDFADLSAWLAVAGSANLPSGNPYLPGDGNLDGVVDGSDFNLWNGNKFTSTAAWCSGDFNADGQVDGSDFSIWNSQKFTASDGISFVPEPGVGWWLTLLLVVGRRR